MGRITVVGSFVTDMVATMPRFPEAGETILGERLRVYPGGKGANQCVAVRRLGGDVAMVGMLGKDENGEKFLSLFREEGIDVSHVYRTEEEPTSVAQVQIDGRGRNRICVIPGANYCLTVQHLQDARAAICASSMVIAQMELRPEVTEALARLCAESGVPFMLNPAPAAPLSDEVLRCVSYLTPNETELALISGLPPDTDAQVEKACDSLLARGVRNIVATLGSRGAYVAGEAGRGMAEGFRVEAVDTVAAGDSFNGALAVALSEGKPVFEAVRFANAMGALTVQKRGAIPSLHTRSEVEAFLRAHGG